MLKWCKYRNFYIISIKHERLDVQLLVFVANFIMLNDLDLSQYSRYNY